MLNQTIEEIYKYQKLTGYIQSMSISREMDCNSAKEWNLTLVLSKCPVCDDDIKIKLNFYNVQDIKIGNINNFFKIFLEIVYISGAKMGNRKYCVEEIEYSMISFKCSHISYNIINPPLP